MHNHEFLITLEQPIACDYAEQIIQRALEITLSHQQLPHACEVHLHTVTPSAIQQLNKQSRQQDKPTNVLSFPVAAQPHLHPPVFIGDIVICPAILEIEAKEASLPLSHHLSHLCIHAILHLLGYDHEEQIDFERMSAIEIECLEHLNIANPYE